MDEIGLSGWVEFGRGFNELLEKLLFRIQNVRPRKNRKSVKSFKSFFNFTTLDVDVKQAKLDVS